MAQSPEYPDLRWMPPASWTNADRTSVQLIVIHTTEGSEGPTSAEDGAGYDQRRTDGTSTHFFHDADSTVQCVRTADQAHAARAQGNRRGIQHELCGRAGQGAAGWADPVSQGTLRQAARQCARDAKRWGIPVRHLTVAQVAAGEKGFCGHVDVTFAFPQDKGTHTDPGPFFPWSQFLDLVRAEMEDFPMDQATFNKLMTGWAKTPDGAAALGVSLEDKIGDKANADRTVGDVFRDVAKLRGVLVGDKGDTANARLSPTAPLAQLLAVAGDVEEIKALVAQLEAPKA
jgi:hypothetical protein